MSELAAVLFDMDGTVVDTEVLWHEAEVRTMAAFDFEWLPVHQDASVGGPFDTVVEYMSELCGADPGDIAREIVTEIETLMTTRELVIQPGVLTLHAELLNAGIPLGLVSNSWRVLVEMVLASSGLRFDVTVAGDEVQPNKPDPQPYLTAAKLLGVDPADCVVLEDSTTGIISATEAGCAVVAIPQVNVIEPAPRRLVVSSLTAVTVQTLRDLVSD